MASSYKQNRCIVSDIQHFIAGYSLDSDTINALNAGEDGVHYNKNPCANTYIRTNSSSPVLVDEINVDLTAASTVDVGIYGSIEYDWILTPRSRENVEDHANNVMSGKLHCRVSRGTCQGIELVPQTHYYSPFIQIYPEIIAPTLGDPVNRFRLYVKVESESFLSSLPMVFSAVRSVLWRVTAPTWSSDGVW